MSARTGAGGALLAGAIATLARLARLNGAYEGPPVRASFPYAVVEAGPESDWSHKTGEGREVRLAVTIHDEGERPGRLRELMAETEEILAGLDAAQDGWRIVTLLHLRSRLVSTRSGAWAGVIEYRARMLRL